jgi:site-specific DNA recombinase
LRSSYLEEKEFRERETKKLSHEFEHLQTRINRAYEDRLDGIINDAYWLDVSAKWRKRQDTIQSQLEKFKNANRNYLDNGIRILELAQSAYSQYVTREPMKKRELLNFLLSNCTLDGLTLYSTYKKPFNFIAEGLKLHIKLP